MASALQQRSPGPVVVHNNVSATKLVHIEHAGPTVHAKSFFRRQYRCTKHIATCIHTSVRCKTMLGQSQHQALTHCPVNIQVTAKTSASGVRRTSCHHVHAQIGSALRVGAVPCHSFQTCMFANKLDQRPMLLVPSPQTCCQASVA